MKTMMTAVTLAACMVMGARSQQQDFSQVQIKTTKLAGNFYMLEGSGGTIGVLPGPDGVFMVDTQFAPLGDKIVAAIKQISDGRIRYLVNTHVHPDHVGGNENIGKQGATIFARENLRARMVKPAAQANGQPGVPAPALALSNARTQWGVCRQDGQVRLNWRLIHLPLRLADYVVAHELAHLREMNHSARFWAVVGRLYPDYAAARRELRESSHRLPIL